LLHEVSANARKGIRKCGSAEKPDEKKPEKKPDEPLLMPLLTRCLTSQLSLPMLLLTR
jgi:hypothetical protein